jgi:uncharacterized SAM-binding protein YcdF (DUF218 family)
MLRRTATKLESRGLVGRRMPLAKGLVVAIALLLFALRDPLLGTVARFLVVENPLRPAVAIIALSGSLPTRTIEAAKVFQEGWAPRVLLVPSVEGRVDMLHAVGVEAPYEWEVSREVLIQLGVPPAAIQIAHGLATNTRSELCLAAAALQPADAPVIIVTSPYHTRRAQLLWEEATQGKSFAIMHATDERYPGDRWWLEWEAIPPIAREYLGLLNVWTQSPPPERRDTRGENADACGSGSESASLVAPR